MGKFEKQILINVNPNYINQIFDLTVEYFEQKDYALENSSKASFASFSKGSVAKEVIMWTIWPGASRDCKITYNISFKKMTNQVMLDVQLYKFGHIFTSADRSHFNNELTPLKDYINNHFSKAKTKIVRENIKDTPRHKNFKFCTGCGEKIKRNIKFCEDCGAKQ